MREYSVMSGLPESMSTGISFDVLICCFQLPYWQRAQYSLTRFLKYTFELRGELLSATNFMEKREIYSLELGPFD
jgi:hypothetical protein